MKRSAYLFLTPFVAMSLSAQVSPAWENDLDAALRRAQTERKQVFVDVWAEWCGPCQFLKKKIFPTPEASLALIKVVPASLMVQTKDGKDTPGGRAISEKFHVTAFPTMLVLDASGKELRRKVGAFRSGKELAEWIAGVGVTSKPETIPDEKRPKSNPREQSTETNQTRSRGTRQYETAIVKIARNADQLDAAFTRYIQRHWDGTIQGRFDRPFYALWEDGSLQGKPFPGFESQLSDLRRRASDLRSALTQAEEDARRADVFPGDRRDLRARYKLEHRSWDK